jgi:hypothetical protein
LIRWYIFALLICAVPAEAQQLPLTGVGGAPAAGGGPTLKRSYAYAGIELFATDTGNNFLVNLDPSGTPRAVASGDLIVVSLACKNSDTPTVSGNVSGSFTSAASVSNAGLANPRKYQVFQKIATGVDTQLTVGFSGLTSSVQIENVSVWYNVASSSPIDVTASATGVTGPTVATGSMTTTADNELIYYVAVHEGDGSMSHLIGSVNAITSISPGASFSNLSAETLYGGLAQYQVQATHGAINPSMTINQATHDNFAAIAIAIKSGSSGSAPGAGISIVHTQMFYDNNISAVNVPIPFPTSGNLNVMAVDENDATIPITSVTDSDSNSYTDIDGGATANTQVQYAVNTTPDNGLVVTFHLGTNPGGNDLIAMYDVAGAAASPLDTGATAGGTSTLISSGAVGNSHTEGAGSCTGTSGTLITCPDLPTMTPGQANGLIILVGAIGTGPASAVSPGTFNYVPATWQAGGGDANGFTNGDCSGYYFNPNTSSINFTWSVIQNGTGVSVMAVSFKHQ